MTHRNKISLPNHTRQPTVSAIRERLDTPEETVDLSELAGRWRECQIAWTVQGYSKAISDPGLPGRIRGAFGEDLLARASPEAVRGDPCPWDPPCAFEVLFRKQGRIEPGLDFPSPWVVELDSRGSDLVITLRLFGFACEYAAAAAEALTYALKKKIDYAGPTGFFFPDPVVIDRAITSRYAVEMLHPRSGVILDFLTPVTLTGNTIRENPYSLISTAAARLAGLARWHDLALELDREALLHSIRLLDFEWVEAVNVRWQRGSSRQGKSFRMSGLVGRLVVVGEYEELLLPSAILALGVRSHIGADIAFGCGRFDLNHF